ncbi:MAG: hypothetical protein V3T88_07385 [Nitrosomonadaceae bacterium]
MSNSAINIRPTFRDANGLPRANGLLTFYVNKTTTLASIFSDEDLTVAQSNPYTLDAFGRTAGDIKYTGKLTVKATNADGSDPTSDDDVITSAGDISITEQFQTTESDPQAMTVLVKAGKVMNAETLVSIANQTTTTITAPTSNPRIDRIVINRLTGVFTIITGSESATPTAPTITAGNAPSSQILLATTTTVITDALITDERISGSVEPSNANTTETLTNKVVGGVTDTNLVDKSTTETIAGKWTHSDDIVFATTKGLDMSANTGAAGEVSSVLDWFEEGTWTPTMLGTSGNASSYTTQWGVYTRTGNRVDYSCLVIISAKGALEGSLSVGGLPFTSATDTNATHSAAVGFSSSVVSVGTMTANIVSNSAAIEILQWSSGATGVVADTEVDTTFGIGITGSYVA